MSLAFPPLLHPIISYIEKRIHAFLLSEKCTVKWKPHTWEEVLCCNDFFLFLCVQIFLGCTHVSACRGQRSALGIFLSCVPPQCLRQGLALNLKVTGSSWLIAQQAPRIPPPGPSLTPQHGDFKFTPSHHDVDVWDPNSRPHVVQQAFSPLSSLWLPLITSN